MWVILYLIAVLLTLFVLQTAVLLAFKQPVQWTIGATGKQSKGLRLALKAVLQSTLIGSIVLFPYLVGSNPAAYYGPHFPLGQAHLFLYGEGIAIVILGAIYAVELKAGWIYYEARFSREKATGKSVRSALSSLTVVCVEEPFFRGVILQTLLGSVSPVIALPLSAVLFSGAHFLRRVRTYWPAVGLAVLGLWLGVAYYRTGSFWLPMGLHSGGILSIGVHRCFLNYRGHERLVGTQTYPIAGLIAIALMLIGTAITWFLF